MFNELLFSPVVRRTHQVRDVFDVSFVLRLVQVDTEHQRQSISHRHLPVH